MQPALKKITAIAAIAGAAILATHSIAHWALYGVPFDLVEVGTRPEWTLLNALLLVGMIALLLGIVGLHDHQAQRAGVLGLVAFLVLFVGLTLRTGLVFTEILMVPSVAAQAPQILEMDDPPLAMGMAFIVEMATKIGGLVLFGIATIRARVFPVATGYLLVGGMVVSFVPGMVFLGITMGAIGLGWMGWHHLVATRRAEGSSLDRPPVPA